MEESFVQPEDVMVQFVKFVDPVILRGESHLRLKNLSGALVFNIVRMVVFENEFYE